MVRRFIGLLAAAVVTAFTALPAMAETRVALVLGSGNYSTNPMAGALNDAGLIAQTLRDLGFATVEGADLPQAELRQAIASFMAKVREAGPDSIAFVYVSGLGLQHDSESYLIAADTAVERESDIPIGGIRILDITRALAAIPSKAKVVLLDLSREHPFANVGQPVRPGIGVIDGAPGMLITSAAAPGAMSSPTDTAYGRFALALSEQLREPGVAINELIARARLRVHQQSNGRDTPWEVSSLQPPVPILTERPDNTSTGSTPQPLAERPPESLSIEEAYALAIERDTIQGYQVFLRAYPDGPLALRIKRLLAAKREAVVWRQTLRVNSPEGYWTYLRRYRNGPHVAEARWRLERLSAPVAPPPTFAEVVYDDIPPPLPMIEVIDDPGYWEPAPAAFYDEVVLAPVYLGPPLAPLWALPPPPPPVWGYLPVVGVAAAVVAVPFILPRFVRRPVAPVVLTPQGGPRFGAPGGVRPFAPNNPGGRALPGSAGGNALPGTGRPQLGGPQFGNRGPTGIAPSGIAPNPGNQGVGGKPLSGQGNPGFGNAGRGIGPGIGNRGPNLGNRGPNFGNRGPNIGSRGADFGNRGPNVGNRGPNINNRGGFNGRPGGFNPGLGRSGGGAPVVRSFQPPRQTFQPRVQAPPRQTFSAPRQSFQAPRPSFTAPRAAPNNQRRRF
ncbi:hypothetical protein E8L99_13910 [Phreatobacter aquaticus]|uniref:Caspase family p20 domain-containing protein n=1 Tax=Phreatobacter aquaticus TaxID=2570229 RepID=A0A4D7QRP7_9HYPH|nr:caspase family protein [Phreatobacter aquaticus]QCK86772.1 hypothetical protein E8L99_13910 [Phreatobacter aquaticus]